MAKFCIVGCHYNGTTSLFEFMLAKGLDVVRDEGLFTLYNGYSKYGHRYPGRIPVIIMALRKQSEFNFEELLKGWYQFQPVLLILEEMAKNPNFPQRLGAAHGDELFA